MMTQIDTAKTEPPPWPLEIRLAKSRKLLHIAFDDGALFDFSAEFLRVISPSAELQGHSESERKTIGGKRDVSIIAVDPVGNYAIRIGFDDNHNTGIYTWDYLHDAGLHHDARFQAYLDELAAKGLDRDTPGLR